MYNYVIFDVDGTLIESEKAGISALQKMLRDYGKHYEQEELAFISGIPGEVALRKLGIDDIKTANQKWNEYVKEYKQEIYVFPEIKEVLEKLRNQCIKTGIVTSRTRQELEDDFCPFGLMDYLSYVVCADDTTLHKPHSEPLLKYMEISGADPSRSVYIGDTGYDLACASGAGIDFALALWGTRSADTIKATHRLKKPADILSLVVG